MRIFLKTISGFLCAFFPLYIVQWLSAYYIEFPVSLIVAVILLIPFYFVARKIWNFIDFYYLSVKMNQFQIDIEKMETAFIDDYLLSHERQFLANEAFEYANGSYEISILAKYNNLFRKLDSLNKERMYVGSDITSESTMQRRTNIIDNIDETIKQIDQLESSQEIQNILERIKSSETTE